MSGTSQSSAGLRPGAVLDGRFRIVESIGRGGFGEVFRADELLPGGEVIRQVALKVLSPGSDLGAWADEAKLLASFSHPALVTVLAAGLCDAGLGADAPFVAMELLDGETLGAVLSREGPLPWRRVLAWARDVAAALDVIHGRSVVHLDLKPTNLFLTREGSLKVLDFGIARRAGAAAPERAPQPQGGEPDALGTAEFLAEQARSQAPDPAEGRSPRRAAIVGTPGYMAPEVLEERPATPAADAYALAACIVHLATGKLPQDVPDPGDDVTSRRAFWDEIRHATSAGKLRPIDLPRGVAALCERLLALEPSARGVAPGGLAAAVEAAWQRPFGVPDPPYLGLAAFGTAAEGMLFGRDDDIARLARDLDAEVALVLQGVSGSGKSSLAMAGVVPALSRRDAACGPDWRAVVARPGADPDAALAKALGAVAPELAEASAADAAAYARAHGLGLAVVLDQLEELVTQGDPGRRGRFVAFLAEAAALPREAPLRVLGTLREDFTSTILGIEPLGERLRDALRFVGPPTMAAVRAIVAHPAELAGVRVLGVGEVASDVERELRAGDGRLPLVALALSAWWGTRAGGTLTAAAYRELGGVRIIFRNLADGVFQSLSSSAQAEARAVLLALSGDGRTRKSLRRAALRDGARDPQAFDEGVRAFVEAGLILEAAGSLDVVHEFLFTAWDRLDGWLSDARARKRLASALVEGARTWQELGRPVSRLPSEAETALTRLAVEEGALRGDDAALQGEWIAAAQRRKRTMRVQGALLVAALLAAVVLGMSTWARTVKRERRLAEEAHHRALLASDEAQRNEVRARKAQADAREAQEEAERTHKAQERAAEVARREQAELGRLLREAETETHKARVRCNWLERRGEAREGAVREDDLAPQETP